MMMETKTNKIKDRENLLETHCKIFFFFLVFFSNFFFSAKLINTFGILHIPYMNITCKKIKFLETGFKLGLPLNVHRWV